MPFNVTLEINQSDLERNLERELSILIAAKVPAMLNKIRKSIQEIIGASIRGSPEYSSLISGDLREQFGLGPDQNVEFVIDTLIETIQAEMKLEFVQDKSFGTIRIELLPPSDDLLFDIPGTSYISDASGAIVPWLRWLLFEGDSKILVDYEIDLSRGSRKASRTGRAIMIKRVKNPSKGWEVPTEFSGVEDNNWLTRALEPAMTAIFDLIINELGRLS